MESNENGLLRPDGIDGTTGRYLWEPVSESDILEVALGHRLPSEQQSALEYRNQESIEEHLGAAHGVDVQDLASAGWGVIVAADDGSETLERLRLLLDLRRAQASTRKSIRYREFSGSSGYVAGTSAADFLLNNRSAPGPVNPDRMPYYLLIVGSPAKIPYSFQLELSAFHAVGRLDLSSEECAAYACAAVEAEGRASSARTLAIFGPYHAGDRATSLSDEHLTRPLARTLAHEHPNWHLQPVLGPDATQARLKELINQRPPSLLFTAGHGLGYPSGHRSQTARQGAIVCSDWLGPATGPVHDAMVFAAEDVSTEADLRGMVSFHFGCYSGGCPAIDSFSRSDVPRRIASAEFTAALPKRFLAQGALACVAHLDRAWSCSFHWPESGEQTEVFRSTLAALLTGQRIGSALEFLAQRYAGLAAVLLPLLDQVRRFGRAPDSNRIARYWTAYADARNYLLLGDPAVRIAR